jgi:aldose sugar dehydrogenase
MKIQATFLIAINIFFSCNSSENPPQENTSVLEEPKIKMETVFTDRGIIWGFAFLPNGDIIFTEKTGKISIFSNNKVTELTGGPTDVVAGGQGGMLDICVHPDYKNNGWIYASYSSVPTGGEGQLNLIRFKISGNSINSVEHIFKSSATNRWRGHYGSRIVFDKKGFLYLSIGEGGTTTGGGENSPNKNAQNVKEAWGKVHRMTADGKVPSDNPILPGNTAPTTIYSYGHRNPQGLVLNADTDEVYETEHGPKGGDEFNLVKKGLNYGWPLVSFGVNYDGSTISANPTREGIEAPLHYWTPSIGACGLAYVSSTKYGSWKGSFLTGGLALQNLSRVEIKNGKAVGTTPLNGIGRVRDVKESPDGYIYLSIESPGRIVRLLPE